MQRKDFRISHLAFERRLRRPRATSPRRGQIFGRNYQHERSTLSCTFRYLLGCDVSPTLTRRSHLSNDGLVQDTSNRTESFSRRAVLEMLAATRREAARPSWSRFQVSTEISLASWSCIHSTSVRVCLLSPSQPGFYPPTSWRVLGLSGLLRSDTVRQCTQATFCREIII